MKLALASRPGLLTVALLMLAACEGGGDPVQQALRDASAERQAAAYQGYDQASATPSPPATVSVDDVAVKTLIADGQRAVASAERVRDATTDPALRNLAEKSVAAHKASIAELEAWRQARP